MKTIGIVAHSAEGAALCFLTAVHEGEALLGPHLHPPIVLSGLPMGWSLPGWESGEHALVAKFLSQGVRQVAAAGADFYVCPDNTAHLVLERIAMELPIPGLHIAEVVCREIVSRGFRRPALLGTRWTMTGSVYPEALGRRSLPCLVPEEAVRERLNAAIFDELCRGIFRDETAALFLGAIDRLRAEGADCVILGCTEIPLLVSREKASLPVLDSTRLLAKHAVLTALDARPVAGRGPWLAAGEALLPRSG